MTDTWKHAARELGILMSNSPDDFIGDFIPEILALCEAFGKSGQSSFSSPFTAAVLVETVRKLCLHQPITPLTGADDEWNYGVEDIEQLESVFKYYDCNFIKQSRRNKSVF